MKTIINKGFRTFTYFNEKKEVETLQRNEVIEIDDKQAKTLLKFKDIEELIIKIKNKTDNNSNNSNNRNNRNNRNNNRNNRNNDKDKNSNNVENTEDKDNTENTEQQNG